MDCSRCHETLQLDEGCEPTDPPLCHECEKILLQEQLDEAHRQITILEGRARGVFLTPVQHYALDRCAFEVNRAFSDSAGCYLVGSSLLRRDFRDVDVRLMLNDDHFDRLFPATTEGDAFWSFLCFVIAAWFSREVNLPVDFQIQRTSNANKEHGGIRSALGCFLQYHGQRPTTLK